MPITINGTTGIAGVDGTASVPAFKGNDADTGIFYPTANEVAAAAGGSSVWNASSTFGYKNRIINGGMVIDQRNNGASVTSPSGAGAYVMDRWAIFRFNDTTGTFTCARSTTAPAGFTNSALITVTAAQASVPSNAVYRFAQSVEGFNVSDFGWGTANAQSIALGFWVRSSVTGTYGGRLRNNANNRSYVFQYTVNSANTFEYKTITIPGDTSGTWLTDNSTGVAVEYGLGDGSNFQGTANAWQAGEFTFASGNVRLINTNGATWQVTGVQLERGSVATSFDFRNYGVELAMCQRYFQLGIASLAVAQNSSSINGRIQLTQLMRATPSLGKAGLDFNFGDMVSIGYQTSATPTITTYDLNNLNTAFNLGSFPASLVSYRSYRHEPVGGGANGVFTLSAEL